MQSEILRTGPLLHSKQRGLATGTAPKCEHRAGADLRASQKSQSTKEIRQQVVWGQRGRRNCVVGRGAAPRGRYGPLAG